MKLHIETGRVKWAKVWLVVFCLVLGAALGGLAVLMAPTQVVCRFMLPEDFQIPSRS